MKRTIIDASQLELTEKVVSIKRVTKVVKQLLLLLVTAMVMWAQDLEKQLKFLKQSAKEKKML